MVDSAINGAVDAYRQTVDRVQSPGAGAADGPGEAVPAFSSLIRSQLEGAVDASLRSERLSEAAIAGNADVNDVVLAVNSAEMTLQTITSIRDRLVQAYQQIIRMPI